VQSLAAILPAVINPTKPRKNSDENDDQEDAFAPNPQYRLFMQLMIRLLGLLAT
jgi:hypothetical protein